MPTSEQGDHAVGGGHREGGVSVVIHSCHICSLGQEVPRSLTVTRPGLYYKRVCNDQLSVCSSRWVWLTVSMRGVSFI